MEQHVLDILGRKMRLFELIVGEVSEVLGHFQKGRSFEQMVADIWLSSENETEEKAAFDNLGEAAGAARVRYDGVKRANAGFSILGEQD